jgi:hypothetical protein
MDLFLPPKQKPSRKNIKGVEKNSSTPLRYFVTRNNPIALTFPSVTSKIMR